VLLMAAAVADFRPTAPAAYKLKKDDGVPEAIELEQTDDIVAGLARRRRSDQVLVGFAAEHGEQAIEYGRAKLAQKRLDAIVVNDISRPDIGFEVDANEVAIISATGERRIARTSKRHVAALVLDEVQRLRESGEETGGATRADARSPARV
jgi:phosphopantothenoylcysteine decarboxylase/phosphopantothenate--cysteine ligase